MTEEKKATVDVNVTVTAIISYKDQCDNDIIKINLNISDAPVDAKDELIKVSAVNGLIEDLEKGNGFIRAVDTIGDRTCFITMDFVKKFTVLNVEIKRGE